MMTLFSSFLLAAAPSSSAKDVRAGPSCEFVLANLGKVIDALADVRLSAPPAHTDTGDVAGEPQPCQLSADLREALNSGVAAKANIELARAGSRTAAMELGPPMGSGHFVDVVFAAKERESVVGACWTTSTAAWINAPAGELNAWLRDAKDGKSFLVPSTVHGHPEQYTSTLLLFPARYRWVGDMLRVDRRRMKDDLRSLARTYGHVADADVDEQNRRLHRAASEAMEAFSRGRACPSRS